MDIAKRRRIMEKLEAETPMVYDAKVRDNMVDHAAQESDEEADAEMYANEFKKGEDSEDDNEWMNIVGEGESVRESVSPRRIQEMSHKFAKKKFVK